MENEGLKIRKFWYSSQEKVNHRWELNEVGKSKSCSEFQSPAGKLARFVFFQFKTT